MKKSVNGADAGKFFNSKEYLEKAKEENSALSKYREMLTGGNSEAVSDKNLGRAAVIMKQLEKSSESAGGYAGGVGATSANGMGIGGFVPFISQPIFKRVLTESSFVGGVVEFQPMQGNVGQIFGVRMLEGQIGDATDQLDKSRELGRPLNNFKQVGGLKLYFEAEVVAETAGGAADGGAKVTKVALVDGSYKKDVVKTGDTAAGFTLTNIEPNFIGTSVIEGVNVTWDFVALTAAIKADINANGQWGSALTTEFLDRFKADVFAPATSAETIIKAMSTSGIGINPQYAIGLGEYGSALDPNRDKSDLATKTFLGGAASKFMQVTPRVETKTIEATERVAKSEIIRNLEEDFTKAMGIDYQEMIVEQLKKLVIETMDLEILQNIKATALDTTNGGELAKVFDMNSSNDKQGRWLQEKITTLIACLVERGENIHKATGRMGRGDFAVVTPLTSALLISGGSLYNNFDIKDDRATNSSKLGKVAGFEMHSDIWGEIVDLSTGQFSGYSQMVVGLKSKGAGESGVIVGTNKPISISGPVVDAQDHNKTILVTTRFGVASNVVDSGAHYRAVLVKGASEVIYG